MCVRALKTGTLGSFVIAGLLALYLCVPFPSEVSAQASVPAAKQDSRELAKEQADDPFSPLNKVKEERGDTPSIVIDSEPGKQNKGESAKGASTSVEGPDGTATELNNDAADRIDFQVAFKPQRVRRGQIFQLIINGAPKPGYHTYPMTKLAADAAQDAVFASKIIYKEASGLQPLWPVDEKGETEFEHAENVGWFLEYKGPFTWTQDILVLPDAKPGPITLPFKLNLTVCDAKGCLPGTIEYEVKVDVSDQAAIPLSAALHDRLKAGQPEIARIPVPVTHAGQLSKGNEGGVLAKQSEDMAASRLKKEGQKKAGPIADPGIIAFALLGIGWGALSLLTPCVFPMIPITVSFFLKQSEKQHHQPLTMALVYSGTIVAVLTGGGLILQGILQQVVQHWATNLVLGAIFVVFALSLFGMFEITMPSWLVNMTSAREGQGGLVGTMFMALTFTLISFACVAPFYGAFIGLTAAAQSATEWVKLSLGALAFSVTFASPFFLLALFPSLLRKLPKSGSWMNTVKVVMAFLELAAAIKFLRAFEVLYYARARFLTYDLVLGIYVIIALLCGLYLLSLYRLPHDDAPAEHIGVPRLLFGMAFLTVGLYIMPGLFKTGSGEQQRPSGPLFAWVDSFLLPDTDEDPNWIGNLNKGLAEAEKNRRLVFIDFTGQTCTNCKLNEKNVFSKRDVKELFTKYVLVQLYTDAVPPHYLPTTTADENRKLQREVFKDIQLPLYAIVRPLSDGKFEVVGKYDEGLINDVEAFKDFLKKPQAAAGAVARAVGG